AFDAIDLIFWQAGDLDTISRRAEWLAPAIGVDTSRLLDWCIAFAGMAAGDLGGTGQRAEPPGHNRSERVRAALSLAAQAPPVESRSYAVGLYAGDSGDQVARVGRRGVRGPAHVLVWPNQDQPRLIL